MRRVWPARDGAEQLADHGAGGRDVDIPGDDQRGVIGHVVGGVEVDDVLNRRLVQFLDRADGALLVGRVIERAGEQRQAGERVRHVGVAQVVLFVDDGALVVEVGLVDDQRGQAVGFDPERQRELVRRQRRVVDGHVGVGVGVERAAGALDQGEDVAAGEVGGFLEHHVLEEMGEAAAALRVVSAADVVEHVDGDGGRGGVFDQDYFEAVVERELGHVERRLVLGGGEAEREQ